jgi:hypothetical protein
MSLAPPVRFHALAWLQSAVVVLAAVLFFRKSNLYFLWLLLPLMVLALRGLVFPGFRRRLYLEVRRLWTTLDGECDRPLPWRAVLVFVTGPAFVFLLANQRTLTNGDTWPVVPSVSALLADGSLRLDAAVGAAPACYGRPLPYSVLTTDTGVYSRYPSGMVPFVLPWAGAAKLCGAHNDRPAMQLRLEKWTAASLTALSLTLFCLLALHFIPAGPSLVTTALLTVGSALTSSCSQALWQQGGVVFWMLVILLAEVRHHRRPFTLCPLLQGAAAGMMLACRLSVALFLVCFGVWLLRRAPRRALVTAVFGLFAYLPWMVWHVTVYGDLFGPSTGQFASTYWSWNIADGLAGILASPSRGLLVYQPWTVLALVGPLLAWRAGGVSPLRKSGFTQARSSHAANAPRSPAPEGWWRFCLASIMLHLMLVANWRIWWGGHCWGSRLLTEVVVLAALLALPTVAALWNRRGGKAFLLSLALLSFLPHAPVLFTDALAWNRLADQRPDLFWSWREAPFLYPLQR